MHKSGKKNLISWKEMVHTDYRFHFVTSQHAIHWLQTIKYQIILCLLCSLQPNSQHSVLIQFT